MLAPSTSIRPILSTSLALLAAGLVACTGAISDTEDPTAQAESAATSTLTVPVEPIEANGCSVQGVDRKFQLLYDADKVATDSVLFRAWTNAAKDIADHSWLKLELVKRKTGAQVPLVPMENTFHYCFRAELSGDSVCPPFPRREPRPVNGCTSEDEACLQKFALQTILFNLNFGGTAGVGRTLNDADVNVLQKTCGGDNRHIRHNNSVNLYFAENVGGHPSGGRFQLERVKGDGVLKYNDQITLYDPLQSRYRCVNPANGYTFNSPTKDANCVWTVGKIPNRGGSNVDVMDPFRLVPPVANAKVQTSTGMSLMP